MLDGKQVFTYFTNTVFHLFVNQDRIITKLCFISKSPTNLVFRYYFYKWSFTLFPWIFFDPVKFFMKHVVQNFKFSTFVNECGYPSRNYGSISIVFACV